jgi:hypothetical protein
MGIAESVLTKLRSLPPDKQQEVVDFVDFLHARAVRPRPKGTVEGLWADFGVDITEEDIAEARREMWGNFPRDDI